MALTLKNTNRYPALIAVGADLASHITLLQGIKECVEIGQRRRGDPRASFVTLGELEDLGLVNIRGDNQLEPPTEWDEISGKPTAFPPESHLIADNNALGPSHSVSGATAGHVLRATGATTAKFMQLLYSDLGSIPAEFPSIAPQYLIQTEEEKLWVADDFIKGHNIIGVRYDAGPSTVFIPHTLPVERIIIVKDEAGLGAVSVVIY